MNAFHHTTIADGDSTELELHGAAAGAPPSTTAVEGGPTRLVAALRRSPELLGHRSLVIDQAVDEFFELAALAPNLSPSAYANRFADLGASIENSIYRQLEVDLYVARRRPELAGSPGLIWPEPGGRLGAFEIVEELGRGALARVYLGRQLDVGGRQVVVKVCCSAAGEAYTLGQLRHPNVVPVYSAARDERTGAAVLCMPFLGRSTLFDLIDAAWDGGAPDVGDVVRRAGRLWERPDDQLAPTVGHGPPRPQGPYFESIAYLGAQLADALHHVHSLGVVHGDVKPSNVLLTVEGEPLLMDFNLSGNAALATTARGGTLPYMPPEQLASLAEPDATASYDARSDVYSLGVVLYELLSGRLPYAVRPEGDEVAVMARRLLAQQRAGCTPLREANGSVPRSLAATVERCLAWDPNDRFSSALELQDALRAELRPLRRLRRQAWSRRRNAVQVAAGVFVAWGCWLAYAATLDPPEVRAFSRGVQLQQAGDFAGATVQFIRALELSPQYRAPRFELGRSLLRQGNARRALEQFFALAKDATDPQASAYVAYCQGQLGRQDLAMAWYSRALDAGYQSGALHNNFAVAIDEGDSHSSPSERSDEIERHLSAALELLPESPTVKLNWLIYELHRRQRTGAAFSPRALVYANELLGSFGECSDVCLRVAELYCLAFADDAEKLETAAKLLNRAYAAGAAASVRAILELPSSAPLHGIPSVKSLAARLVDVPPKQRRGPSIPRMLEPASDLQPTTPPSIASQLAAHR